MELYYLEAASWLIGAGETIELGQLGYRAFRYGIKNYLWRNGGYRITARAIRSAVANRTGKRSFTEVGYQFLENSSRGGDWGEMLTQGTTLNPAAYNDAGYATLKQIWRSPGMFTNTEKFLRKDYLTAEG